MDEQDYQKIVELASKLGIMESMLAEMLDDLREANKVLRELLLDYAQNRTKSKI